MLEFQKTKIEGVFLIKPQVIGDHRGFFLETYREEEFLAVGIDVKFIQDNHSFSTENGVLRGLHFQKPPFTQAKLVRVIKGKVIDVVVDLRKFSPTFGQWESFELSEDNFQMLFVPHGMAHGFCLVTENTHFVYKVDNYYHADSDGGVLWNDPDLGITWPVENPIVSEKDSRLPIWKEFLKDNPF
jgi:dTDP-4-dehydrorhamnose 3,5-epimerase